MIKGFLDSLAANRPFQFGLTGAIVGIGIVIPFFHGGGLIFLGVTLIACSMLKEILQEKISSKINQLACENEQLARENENITRQRDILQKIASNVAAVIKIKANRFRKYATSDSSQIEVKDLVSALDPELQILSLVRQGWFFFEENWKPSTSYQLRLGIFMQRDQDSNQLYCAYSDNGESFNCINPNPKDLKLADTDGIRSAVVECYHKKGTHPYLIFPDTEAAMRQGRFYFLKPEQDEYLKSIFVLKTKIYVGAKKLAVLFSADCSLSNYFSEANIDFYRAFFIEFSQRLEYELNVLSVTSRLKHD